MTEIQSPYVIDLTKIVKAPEIKGDRWYDVTITRPSERTSTAGNPQILMNLRIDNDTESPDIERTIFDSLIFLFHDMSNYAWQRVQEFTAAVYGPNEQNPDLSKEALAGERLAVFVEWKQDKRKEDRVPGVDNATGVRRPDVLKVTQYAPYGTRQTSIDDLLTDDE